MAASDVVKFGQRGPSLYSQKVATAAVLYALAQAALRTSEFATSADRGYVGPFTAAKGVIPLGPAQPDKDPSGGTADSVTGNLAASPAPTTSVFTGSYIRENYAVTGVTGVTDHGKWVYLSDDNTLTLTRPALGIPVGLVLQHRSGTKCDLLMFGLDVICAISAAGNSKQLIFLGELDFATSADGDQRTGIKMPFHGKFLEFFGMVKQVNVGSGGTIDLNLEIGGTNVTGGVLTWSTAAANVLGERLDATAITAANEFHEGDLVDIEGASAGGTRTSGLLELYALVETLPGL